MRKSFFIKNSIVAMTLLISLIFSMIPTAGFAIDSDTASTVSSRAYAATGAGEYGDEDETIIVNAFYYQLQSGAVKDNDLHYTWTPSRSNNMHPFVFVVDYSVNGIKDSDPGDIEIRIPLHILKNKDGEFADELEMSVPLNTEEHLRYNPEYVYEIREINGVKYAVITNYKIVVTEGSTARTGYFEFAYYTTEETFEYRDMDETVPFTAEIWVKDNVASRETGEIVMKRVTDEGTSIRESEIEIQVDTKAKLISTKKETPTHIYSSWQSNWGTKPEDAELYAYVIWEIQTEIDRNITQKYDFMLSDIPRSADMEVVGYRMQGCGSSYHAPSELSSLAGLKDLTVTGKRYDYVLTRHLKSSYDETLADDESYTLINDVTATLHPADGIDDDTSADASAVLSHKKPGFTPPIGSANLTKRGERKSFQLTELKQGVDAAQRPFNAISGLTYDVTFDNNGYRWTVSGDPYDPDNYGKIGVTYQLTDDTLSIGDELEPADYDFSDVSFSYTTYGAAFNEDDLQFDPEAPDYSAANYIALEVKTVDGSWVTVAHYDMLNKKFVNVDNTYITWYNSVSRSVGFAAGVKGYRFTNANTFGTFNFKATPSVTLYRTDNVLNTIGDMESVTLTNRADGLVTVSDEKVYERSVYGSDYIYPENRESSVEKKVTTASNNVIGRYYTITWKASMKETLTLGTTTSIRQDSGTFYDLLPDGNQVDINSVLVETETGFLDPSAYTVTVTPNYNYSNRSLLRVQIKDSADYYNVYFDTVYSWESVQDYGKIIYNPIAYETGNESIANGGPDNGGKGKITQTENCFFTPLDPASKDTDNRFIYSEAQFDATVVTAAASGLDKKVRANEDSLYTYQTVVSSNETYMYQLRYANGNIVRSKDLIFYDNIEKYVPEAVDHADWHGTLQSIDVSQLTAAGIRPIVYYHSGDWLSLTMDSADTGNLDLSNTGVWNKINLDYSSDVPLNTQIADFFAANPDIAKSVKSIAVDMSQTKGGEDFILDYGSSVSVTVYLKSPDKNSEEIRAWIDSADHQSKYPMTYNDVYISNRVVAESEESEENPSYLYEQAYTSVSYHITGNIHLHKYNSQNVTENIPGILFRLFGISDYGNRIDITRMSDSRGNVDFMGIEQGTYSLQEVSDTTTNPDWQPDHTERIVVITPEEVKIDGSNYEDIYYQFGNEPRAHADIEFTKHRYGNKNLPVAGAVFRLTGQSDYGNDVLMVETADDSGTVRFDNLEQGTYTMREVEVPEGYILSKTAYTVYVDENGNYSITAPAGDDSLTHDLNGDYYIANDQYADLFFYKVSSEPDEDGNYVAKYLNGVTFSLKGTSQNGTDVNMTAVSNDTEGSGSVRFSMLEPGTYILMEEELPEEYKDTYIMDSAQHIVTVSRSGEVTIDGAASNTQGLSHIYNPRKGKDIIVVKKWVDNLTDRSALNPVIAVTTTSPEINFKSAVFKKANWNTFFDSSFPRSKIRHFTRMPMSQMQEHIDDGTAKNIKNTETNKNNQNYSEMDVWGWFYEDPEDPDNSTFYWASDAPVVKLSSDTSEMFWNSNPCNFHTIDLSGIDTSMVKNFYRFFQGNGYLDKVVGTIDASSSTTLKELFSRCFRLTSVPTIINTQNVTNLQSMFYCVFYPSYIDLSTMDTSKVTTMAQMFRMDSYKDETGKDFASRIKNINLISFDTSNVTSMESMFDGCRALERLDLSTFNVEKLQNANSMFKRVGSDSMSYLDVSSFKTTSLTNAKEMFYRMSVSTIYASDEFSVDKITNSDQMFYWSDNLVGGAETKVPAAHNSNPKAWYDSSWAHIDSVENPGYFTYKEYNPATPVVKSTTAASDTTPGSYGDSTVLSNNADVCSVVRDDVNNRWIYTFTVGEGESYVWEAVVPEGYTADYDGTSLDKFITVKENGDRTATITNTREGDNPDPTYGGITVSKSVKNQDETTVADWPENYHFTLTLTDEDNNALAGTAIFGGVIFTDGSYTFTLSPEKTSVTVSDIPAGYHYTVSEISGTVTHTKIINGSVETEGTVSEGTVPENDTVSIAYINTITEDRRDTTDVRVKKTISGGSMPDAEFTFYANLTNLKANTAYRLEKEDGTLIKSFDADEYGEAFFSFSLKDGETAVLKNLPYADEYFSGATYLINEARAEGYRPSYTVTDANGLNKILKRTETGSLNTQLSTARETVDVGEDVTVTYTNSIVQTRNLVLEKKLQSPIEDTRSFAFEVHFEGLGQETAYNISGVGRMVSDADGKAAIGLQIAPGEQVIFKDLPVGCTYRVVELDTAAEFTGQTYIASYEITSTGGGTIEKASDHADEYGAGLSTDTEILDANEDAVITFTNVLTELDVSKTVKGNMGNRYKKFEFKCIFTLAGVPLADRTFQCIGSNGKQTTLTTDISGTTSFTLRHGEEFKILGLPLHTEFTITEDDENSRGYTVDVVDDSGNDFNDGKGEITLENTHVDFTNTKEVLITTGVDYMMLLLSATLSLFFVAVMVFTLRKRKEED